MSTNGSRQYIYKSFGAKIVKIRNFAPEGSCSSSETAVYSLICSPVSQNATKMWKNDLYFYPKIAVTTWMESIDTTFYYTPKTMHVKYT